METTVLSKNEAFQSLNEPIFPQKYISALIQLIDFSHHAFSNMTAETTWTNSGQNPTADIFLRETGLSKLHIKPSSIYCCYRDVCVCESSKKYKEGKKISMYAAQHMTILHAINVAAVNKPCVCENTVFEDLSSA